MRTAQMRIVRLKQGPTGPRRSVLVIVVAWTVAIGLTGCGAQPARSTDPSTAVPAPLPVIASTTSVSSPTLASAVVSGTVVDARTHSGITGLPVTFTGQDGVAHTSVTDAKSVYTLTLSTGVYRVSCKSSVLDCSAVQAPTVAEPSVTVHSSGTLDLDIFDPALNSPAPAAGKSTSPNPHPYGAYGRVTKNGVGVAGVQVLVDQMTSSLGTAHEIATTDANGYYSVSDLPPGVYTVSAYTDGYCSVGSSDAVTLPAGGEVDFVATAGLCGQ